MRLQLILLFFGFFSMIGHSQDLHWITNNSYDESGNTLENTLPMGAVSYVVSAEVLDATATGSIAITDFYKGGTALSNANFTGSIALGISGGTSPENMYQIRISRSLILGDGGGDIITRVEAFDPEGNTIGQIDDVVVSSGSVLEISKTGASTLAFLFEGTQVATATIPSEEAATYYRTVIRASTEAVSFTYSQNNFTITSTSYPAPSVSDMDRNWTSVKTFDTQGIVTSASVGYFDCLGRGTQAQTKDILTGKNWATETRYDSQGRPALTTMAAPIGSILNFSYKTDFILDQSGDIFNTSDYESVPELPNTVSSDPNTLGWYYSDANTNEPFQDITDRPYSRIVYDALNPGKVRAVVGGNRAFVAGETGLQHNFPQGYSHSMPAAQELYYAFGKDYFPENREGWFAAHGIDPIAVSGEMLTHRATKTIAIDVDGNETVVFTDLEGKTLAAARSNGPHAYDVVSLIGEQGYVDVHLPMGTTQSDITFLGGGSNYDIWDLRTGEVVTTGAMTGGHIYRIAYDETPPTADNTIVYLSGTSINHRTEARGLRYKVNYYEYALNYYDPTGNLLESVQPLGFDNTALVSGLGNTPQHSMVSNYSYNSLGQLLTTSSPDEGGAYFEYRNDGQIRFSQNTKQQENGEYSYTNYDDYARPIESGVCQGEYPGVIVVENTDFDMVANQPDQVSIASNAVERIAMAAPSGTTRWAEGGFYGTNAITGDFRLTFKSINSLAFFGLSRTDHTSTHYYHIDYAIYRQHGDNFQIRENNAQKTGYLSGYSNDQTFTIERIENVIKYYREDVLIYTNSDATTDPLYLDGNIYYTNSSIEDIQVEFFNTTTSDMMIANQPENVIVTPTSIEKINTTASSGVARWAEAGFYGTHAITGDFKLEYTPIGSHSLVGVTQIDYASEDYRDIDYAIYRTGPTVQIRENNSQITDYTGAISNARFAIQREGNTITYWQNDELLYTDPNATDQPVYLDGNIYSTGTKIDNIVIDYEFTPDPSDCSERTLTLYDIPDQEGLDAALSGFPKSRQQEWLSGNVSKTWTESPTTSTTWYSYDVYGRVSWMVQDIIGLGTKIISYTYDDITGAVTQIKYIGDLGEQFTHKYTYNTVGQLITVATSYDNINYNEQARYEYYETGALKRTILGEGVQGIDYVYNIAGALKSINHPSLDGSKDPGGDVNDVFGMIIDYHSQDYRRSNSINSSTSGVDRYDGNIKATRWATNNGLVGDPITQNAYLYEYDHNKWLRSANFGTASNTGVINPNANGDYMVSNLTYDPNGNLLSLQRNKDTYNGSNTMDAFTYHYTPQTNQLSYVSDAAVSNEDAGDLESQNTGNYTYNSIGQLVYNTQDDIQYEYTTSGLVSSIANTQISGSPTVSTLTFGYNDRGHRISKQLLVAGNTTETYYVRDASGQALAIYNGTGVSDLEFPIYGASRIGVNKHGEDRYEVTDHLGNVRAVVQSASTTGGITNIYQDNFEDGTVTPWQDNASTQINSGFLEVRLSYSSSSPPTYVELPVDLIAGHQYSMQYLLKYLDPGDELSKVGISTLTDLDTQEFIGNSGSNTNMFTANYTGTYKMHIRSHGFGTGTYRALLDNIFIKDVTPDPNSDVLQAYRDYYPFGMPMPNRNVEGDYRYAFQGQEKDPETGKEAFELRLWDSRIGRWLTTDPYGQYSSPYLGMGNNPISLIDPDGGFASRIQAWFKKAINGYWGSEVVKNDNGDWILSNSGRCESCDFNILTNKTGNPDFRSSSPGGFGLTHSSENEIPEKLPIYFEVSTNLNRGTGGLEFRFLGQKYGGKVSLDKRRFNSIGFSHDLWTGEFDDLTHIRLSDTSGSYEFSGGAVYGGGFSLDSENNFNLQSTTTSFGIANHIEEYHTSGVHKGKVKNNKIEFGIGVDIGALLGGAEANLILGFYLPRNGRYVPD